MENRGKFPVRKYTGNLEMFRIVFAQVVKIPDSKDTGYWIVAPKFLIF